MVMKRPGSDPSLRKSDDTSTLSSWKSPIFVDDESETNCDVAEPSRTSLRECSVPPSPAKAGKGRWKSLKNRLSIGKRKSVRFAKGKPEVQHTLSRHDLSPQECEDYWLQSYEMEQSLSRCWEIVYAFKKTKKEAKGKKVPFNYCTRGLESYIVDKCHGEHTHRLKREYAYSAVLLRGDGVSDKERSRRYQRVSKASVDRAVEYARRDEVIARRIHAEVPGVQTSGPDDVSVGSNNTHTTEPLSDESNRKLPSNKSLETMPPKSPRKTSQGSKSRSRSAERSPTKSKSGRRSSVEPVKPKSFNFIDAKKEKESSKKSKKKERSRSKSRSRSPSKSGKSKSRSPSKSGKSKSRSPSKSGKSKSRSPSKSRKSRSRSPSKSRKSKPLTTNIGE